MEGIRCAQGLEGGGQEEEALAASRIRTQNANVLRGRGRKTSKPGSKQRPNTKEKSSIERSEVKKVC